MIIRQFKGEDVSLYGMGCMRLPKLGDGSDDSAVDEAAVQEMVDLAIEQGVSYFDTTSGYHNGVSEQVMGRCLAKHPRESFFLADKFPGYDSANWGRHEEIFAQQLQYFPIVSHQLLHLFLGPLHQIRINHSSMGMLMFSRTMATSLNWPLPLS